MFGDKKQFVSLTAYNGGSITFGDNNEGSIVALAQVKLVSYFQKLLRICIMLMA